MTAIAPSIAPLTCQVCGHETATPDPKDLGAMRGNTARFCQTVFRLWRCPRCLTIYSLDPVDFRDIYSDYPLNKRRLDIFARGTLRNLLRRLRRAGLKKTDSILDYGCGNGIFLRFLEEAGYANVMGYDPFASEFASLPRNIRFDCIVNNDTVEHVDNLRAVIHECVNLLKPGGLLYIGTADSEPVDMQHLEPHVMRLHQPFHRILVTQRILHHLSAETGLKLIASYRRSYHDTFRPFSNYRFLDELNKAVEHNLDQALDPTVAWRTLLRRPRLWFYALFGYWVPSAYEPAVILCKPRERA
jgi:2-polyprenyl-3-methyl-5-hydroxy-6-metoxy-1,4-benzoquinol methylase